MVQVIAATFADGVFKPDEPIELLPHTRVRLVVEPITEGDDAPARARAWETVETLWRQSSIDSHGERLSRDQLHERH